MRNSVNHNAIAKRNKVEPTATAFAARDGAVLVTELADGLANIVEQLGWERTSTHACAVGLEDSENLANLVRTDAQTCASACAYCV